MFRAKCVSDENYPFQLKHCKVRNFREGFIFENGEITLPFTDVGIHAPGANF